MGTETTDESVAVAIAALREQMKAVTETLGEIKTGMGQILAIDRTVNELMIHRDSAKRDIELLWQRHEESKARDEDLKERIAEVDSKREKFSNTFSGGLRVFLFIFGALQAGLLGGVVWVLGHVIQADSANALQEQRLKALEQQVETILLKVDRK